MSKRKDIQTVRVEILPSANRGIARTPTQAAMRLKKLVEEQVAEIMARRDDLVFQPFFEQKKISDELKRLQTVPEQRKWSLYFARFGCLVCGTDQITHRGCGMCTKCYGRVQMRLTHLIGRYGKNRGEDDRDDFEQRESVARMALSNGAKALEVGSLNRNRKCIGNRAGD